jgi:hypothetical protein
MVVQGLLGGLGPWEVLLILALFGVPLWILPIVLGVQCAKRKNYSPVWMLFGVNCIGAWIAYAVLASLPGRRPCPHCGGFVAVHWKTCPLCRTQMPPPAMPLPPTASPWPPQPPRV